MRFLKKYFQTKLIFGIFNILKLTFILALMSNLNLKEIDSQFKLYLVANLFGRFNCFNLQKTYIKVRKIYNLFTVYLKFSHLSLTIDCE